MSRFIPKSKKAKHEKSEEEKPEKEKFKKITYADSFTGSFSIAANKDDLLSILRTSKLSGKSLHDLIKMRSGSKALKKQFVLFRSVWKAAVEPGESLANMTRYKLGGALEQAVNLVNGSQEVEKYLALLKHLHLVPDLQEGDPQWAGSWMPVLRFHAKCVAFSRKEDDTRVVPVRLPARRGLSPPLKRRAEEAARPPTETGLPGDDEDPTGDESIVNAALILFLDAAASLVRSSQCEFTMVRVPFIANFQHATFTALTDGALWVRSTEAIRGIIEVKKARRSKIGDKVTMQEAAELVGWIMNSQPWEEAYSGYKCLICEDGDEAWLSFAKPTEPYAAYLRDGTVDEDALLIVERYGPYRVDNAEHMLLLLYAVVAIYLQAVTFDNVSQA
ncbi:hypothetical protein ASPACDRAFT_1859515 [Aspergillus aculeatus ATCC 16872]|uniref:Uncharacterized protein n=1 Tax=Aspergillus aculeatus (strain ATCC 16872 / CBS 172.66 / WB 5094) TaxID=690307 RepID=A0A1L9WJD5_ASPA1|nr:uncharacterized protein ASPACDRAFT_1859515 [Aspergillus aculeatus ATCC 16872]OJJ96265.1 hypothetical protein ASPACDRAFT_1859515 [Aspergillus aculeatus ATCC 16872]